MARTRDLDLQVLGVAVVLTGNFAVAIPVSFYLALGAAKLGLAGLWVGQSIGYALVDALFAVMLACRTDWRAVSETASASQGGLEGEREMTVILTSVNA